MADPHQAKLSALPGLFRSLTDQPLRPLTQARLPERAAVDLFYQGGEPVLVGSPPHIQEARLLAPSVRLGIAASAVGNGGAVRIEMSDAAPDSRGRPPVNARWLAVADEDHRMLLELYAAQALGLSVSHPRIKAGLTQAAGHKA